MPERAGEIESDVASSPHDVIVRFCKLQAKVMREVLDYASSNDCFCGERDSLVEKGLWINEQTAVTWIENVVNEAIKRARTNIGGMGLEVAREVASALGDTFITWQTLSPEAQWARILPMLRSLPVEQRMEAMGMEPVGVLNGLGSYIPRGPLNDGEMVLWTEKA